MQDGPRYDDVVAEVQRVPARAGRSLRRGRASPRDAARASIRASASASASEHNLALLGHLRRADAPAAAGAGRRCRASRMLGTLTGRATGDRLAGSVALAALCAERGARDRARARRRGNGRCGENVALRCAERRCRGADRGEKVLRHRRRARPGRRAPDDRRFRAAAGQRGGARARARRAARVLIGKDTRLSGYMFEAALEAGFVAAGVDVHADRPAADAGHRLPDAALRLRLRRRHQRLAQPLRRQRHQVLRRERRQAVRRARGSDRSASSTSRALTRESRALGRATRVDKSRAATRSSARARCRRAWTSTGLKIVVDCAQRRRLQGGAAHRSRISAPRSSRSAARRTAATSTDGCGSTAPELLQLTVPGVRADAGIALDGDGDRLVMVDDLGRIVDGDQLLYVIAHGAQARRHAARARSSAP